MDQNQLDKNFDTGKIDKYGRAAGNLTYPKNPTWCPGCGNYAIWGALKKGLRDSGIDPNKIVIVYDIGCSGNMADFNKYYGIHALHGRALPTAVGISLVNPELKVIVIAGDGGSFGEGGGHFLNEMRGNHDVTLIVHDNHRYSLTTGQTSPTTLKGDKTKSTPWGAIEDPLNPLAIALVNGASYVAREFAADIPRLATRVSEAVLHKGFSFLDILQPCPVFNPVQSLEWYRERIYKIEENGHDHTKKDMALVKAMELEKIALGTFYVGESPTYFDQMGVSVGALGQKIDRDISDLYNKL